MDEQKSHGKLTFFSGFFAGMAAVSVLGFVVLLIVVFSQGNASGSNSGSAAAQAAENNALTFQPVAGIKADEFVRGNKDSKVEVIEYSDLECPFCLKHNKTMAQLYNEYKDKVKFVFRHFPLSFHENAYKAAMAVECAAEQGKFWEMHDAAFVANEAEKMGVDTWKADAKKMGLDTAKFNACLDGDKYATKISTDQNEGSAAGVSGTPTTFISGEIVGEGASAYAVYKAKLDAELAK
jgi:protein-disulfide isomerase